MYKIRIKHRGELQSEFTVSSSRVSIGSSDECDITLDPERKVEDHHALLEESDGVWRMSPQNGHEVVSRGEQIEAGHELVIGHTFLVGEFVVAWEDETEPDVSEGAFSEETLPVAEHPRFRFLTGAQAGQAIDIEGDLKENPKQIGRSPETNDVVLTDRSISRNHAQLSEDDDGYMLDDAGSTNGLRTSDGSRVSALRLHNGMCFTLGDVEILFECPLKTIDGLDKDSTAPHLHYPPTSVHEAATDAVEIIDEGMPSSADGQDQMNPALRPLMFLLVLAMILIVAAGAALYFL